MVREGWQNYETGKFGEPRIQFLNFEILQEVINNNSKKLTIQFNIRDLGIEIISNLKNELNYHKGDKPIFFDIIDPEKSVKLTLKNSIQKVQISPRLLQFLDEKKWFYKLN